MRCPIFGYYAHTKHNGAICKPSDTIKKGDLIAYSRNVGWTTEPHLHFACLVPAFGE
ncbi:MAG: M23 family metallopeptidase [Flavitalea sp.]